MAPESEGKQQRLPEVKESEGLKLNKLDCKQNFTQHAPRYSDTTLIKTLEKEGIGRPSTYSTIVETIQSRGYVKKIEGRFHPSDSAFVATDILTSCFGDLINTRFTAGMESLLDEVEDGKKDWIRILSDFYKPFMDDLKKAETTLKKAEMASDCVCTNCGKPMVVKLGRTGKFLACSGYPECKTTENIPDNILLFASMAQDTPLKLRDFLDKAKAEAETLQETTAPMLVKNGRYGKFLACSKYPECKTTKPLTQGTGVKCPLEGCNGEIVIKYSKRRRIFYGCANYPTCRMVTWSPPTGSLCPECREPLVNHSTKKLGDFVKCSNKACQYKILSNPPAEATSKNGPASSTGFESEGDKSGEEG